jgi:hypothetical protein
LSQVCSAKTWRDETGIMICRIYKALFAFCALGLYVSPFRSPGKLTPAQSQHFVSTGTRCLRVPSNNIPGQVQTDGRGEAARKRGCVGRSRLF